MKVSAITRGAIFATLLGLSLSQSGYAAQAAPASGSVSVWVDANSTNPCVAKVVKAANKNSNLKINFALKKGWEAATKTAVAGGAGPDVIMTPGPSYTAEYAKAGALAPLDQYVKPFGWDKSFAPWSLKLGVTKGKLYSLPSELETMLLWYNKTLFDKMGLKAPKTTADLNAVADKLSAAGITPFAAGNKEWKGVNEWYISALFNGVAGPENVYKALTGTLKWNSPGFLEATTMLNDWQQKGYLSGALDRFYVKTFDGALADFADGKAGMSMEVAGSLVLDSMMLSRRLVTNGHGLHSQQNLVLSNTASELVQAGQSMLTARTKLVLLNFLRCYLHHQLKQVWQQNVHKHQDL